MEYIQYTRETLLIWNRDTQKNSNTKYWKNVNDLKITFEKFLKIEYKYRYLYL